MDGNRRYGRQRHHDALAGHREGSQALVRFVDWCHATDGLEALTVFAFSTENWNRDPVEIQALMAIFETFVDQIAANAVAHNIRVCVLMSDSSRLTPEVLQTIDDIEQQTKSCSGLTLSICVSYGSRHELVQACQSIARDVVAGDVAITDITEALVSQKLLTRDLPDPDLLLRTSGEQRISNFLLYQIAYAELMFIPKYWPEIDKTDFESMLDEFHHRKRRFGK